MIKTNAVDSFVIKNFGDGHGECKLYLRSNYSDSYYRIFFNINAQNYGYTPVPYNGTTRYRENGPIDNCYFLGSDIINYLNTMINNPNIPPQEKKRLHNCYQYFNPKSSYNFQINYIFDSQNRSYIGSASYNFNLLRLVSISQQTIICMEKIESRIKFSLITGQL